MSPLSFVFIFYFVFLFFSERDRERSAGSSKLSALAERIQSAVQEREGRGSEDAWFGPSSLGREEKKELCVATRELQHRVIIFCVRRPNQGGFEIARR
jgi:hypothetical protein